MGRGSGSSVLTKDSQSILYGGGTARGQAQDLSHEDALLSGVTECYDQLGLLRRIIVPERCEYKLTPDRTLKASATGAIFWIQPSRRLHRLEGPAVEWDNGTKEYWVEGELHREDGPALEFDDGSWEWWDRGKIHREGGPAKRDKDGSLSWYQRGDLHREDGAAVEYCNGGKEYYLNGVPHREDGPALEYSGGRKEYFIHGKKHRIDGPAVTLNGDAPPTEYWLDDEQYTKEEWEKELCKLQLFPEA